MLPLVHRSSATKGIPRKVKARKPWLAAKIPPTRAIPSSVIRKSFIEKLWETVGVIRPSKIEKTAGVEIISVGESSPIVAASTSAAKLAKLKEPDWAVRVAR